MSYIKDKAIIDFLCQVETLIQSLNTKFEPIYYFTLGHTWQAYLQSPKNLASILESFSMLRQYEEFQAISQSQRNKLFIEMIIDPKGNLEQKIYALTSEEQEESKDNERSRQQLNSANSKEYRIECIELFEKAELKLAEHLVFTEEDARLLPIDLIMWGFFAAYFRLKKVDAESVFEKLLIIRQAEISSILTHNQKMRVFIKLYNDWELDLNTSFAKLLENPTLGSKPLSSLIVPEEKMNEIMVQQLALEEKFEQEKARIEKEKQDNEGVLCNICLLDLYDKDEDVYFVDVCVHNYHESCLSDYLNNQFQERKFPVKCPDPDCEAEFTAADLKELMTEENVEKFYEAALDEFIKKNAKDMLYCPGPNCTFAFILSPGQDSLDCPMCKAEYCLKCQMNQHGGDCKDNGFLSFATNKGYKACPSCKFWVEKTVGCDYMACRCGAAFCYACGKDYNDHSVCDYEDCYQNVRMNLVGSRAIEDYLFENQPDETIYSGSNALASKKSFNKQDRKVRLNKKSKLKGKRGQ